MKRKEVLLLPLNGVSVADYIMVGLSPLAPGGGKMIDPGNEVGL